MSKSIDLGKTLDDMISVSAVKPDEPHYPDLYLGDIDDPKILEMPDKGEATIKYRVISRTHREEKGRKDTCSIRLEVLSISPPEGAKKRNGYGDDLRRNFNDYFGKK
jgi:hypothetical protein